MDNGLTISVHNLTKKYGSFAAVNNFSFEALPGRITGFLGPNGAGKTTTLRILLGLAAPTHGQALIGGKRYADFLSPGHVVGASLDSHSFHPGRTARNHLRILAAAEGTSYSRIDEVLDKVGLRDFADRRVGTYSLGMRQRLGLAGALLSDPSVLVLDEPANGLDPEGIRWMRDLLNFLAGQGATVLLSSHLLSEIQQIADHIVIINHGQLVAAGSLSEIEAMGSKHVSVDSPHRTDLHVALRNAQLDVRETPDGLEVSNSDPTTVGTIAFQAGLPLSHLSADEDGLEDVFLGLVGGRR
ncbi:ATP-binding cassette domain-containing protein [Actinomycetaceae bacterium WB03_NA08]|uniref:ATP-binding cassette domain-containing protein n=1 Tax=Scrofimicrobium canadense TaxID=2652290 RepID=A0A6N7VRQ4_9ACTO|nr:ATP-binding cassette domain-containing protein [Scrofimicrobium canadense]MSS84457.1 ATP-binding cassette domain-containing protein [Scrofimicrobium canadense]